MHKQGGQNEEAYDGRGERDDEAAARRGARLATERACASRQTGLAAKPNHKLVIYTCDAKSPGRANDAGYRGRFGEIGAAGAGITTKEREKSRAGRRTRGRARATREPRKARSEKKKLKGETLGARARGVFSMQGGG